jgi:hypothetical protein
MSAAILAGTRPPIDEKHLALLIRATDAHGLVTGNSPEYLEREAAGTDGVGSGVPGGDGWIRTGLPMTSKRHRHTGQKRKATAPGITVSLLTPRIKGRENIRHASPKAQRQPQTQGASQDRSYRTA